MIPILNGKLWTIPKGFINGLEYYKTKKIENKYRPPRLQHYQDRLLYWEAAWRLMATYSHSMQWLSSKEMDTATRVQILDQTYCISHNTNTLGKGMNPNILPPAMSK